MVFLWIFGTFEDFWKIVLIEKFKNNVESETKILSRSEDWNKLSCRSRGELQFFLHLHSLNYKYRIKRKEQRTKNKGIFVFRTYNYRYFSLIIHIPRLLLRSFKQSLFVSYLILLAIKGNLHSFNWYDQTILLCLQRLWWTFFIGQFSRPFVQITVRC